MRKNEKGVTLVTLVITVIVITILASIVIGQGRKTVRSNQFVQFQVEMKLLQTKVNEIGDELEIQSSTIGDVLTAQNRNVLDTQEVTDVLTKRAGGDLNKVTDMKDGFRLFTRRR